MVMGASKFENISSMRFSNPENADITKIIAVATKATTPREIEEITLIMFLDFLAKR